MSELQRYEPVGFAPVEYAEPNPITTIEMAPTEAKYALAKRAFDGLPLERKHADNLATLRSAAVQDPAYFLELCKDERLPVDMSIVINHHETHIHHHTAQQPQREGVSREEMLAYMQAVQQPAQAGITAAEMMAIMQSQQQSGVTAEEVLAIVQANQQQPVVIQQGYSEADLIAASLAASYQPPPPVYYPEPSYYYEAPQIEFSPHIEVHAGGGRAYARSHSEQDNDCGGRPILLIFLFGLFLLLGVGVSQNQ